ncbi:3365_t:CDS:2, partial [Acaulospora colombiana]
MIVQVGSTDRASSVPEFCSSLQKSSAARRTHSRSAPSFSGSFESHSAMQRRQLEAQSVRGVYNKNWGRSEERGVREADYNEFITTSPRPSPHHRDHQSTRQFRSDLARARCATRAPDTLIHIGHSQWD